MKLSYNWLLDHLETKASPEEISETLTKIGLEIEDVLNPSAGLEPFEIAEILETIPHPQADRLKVCKVRRGSGEVLQIVCGAPNARAGLKVVLALAGHTIPVNGLVLKNTAIRGIESFGMLCSASELGLSTESEGILELPSTAKVGDSLVAFLGNSDTIFEVNVTPNRSDCLNIRGLARELDAAGLGTLKPLAVHKIVATDVKGPALVADPLILETGACPHFVGRVIRGVKNGPSPEWLQKKLKSLGKTPISLLVDITNYFCFDLGRPLHAFDLDQVQGNMHLRFAQDGEAFKSLKGQDYLLDSEMTLVADEQGPLALAGVMGGMRSSCSLDTTNIFLESAYFSSSRTAATGRKLNLLSDSRYRFERGIDPRSTLLGLEAATQLILDLCGGEAGPLQEIGKVSDTQKTISFDASLVKKLTDLSLSEEQMTTILNRLGFDVKGKTITVPSWRHDIHESVDLVEEIVRHYGYDKIVEMPLPFVDVAVLTNTQKQHIKFRHVLAGRGLLETITWSMIDEKSYDLFGGKGHDLKIANPLTIDMEYMRPSVIPTMLKAVGRNIDRGQNPIFLFEIGPVYKSLEIQDTHAACLRWGSYNKNHWAQKERWVNVFDAKADMLALLKESGLKEGAYQVVSQGAPVYYHPGRSGVVQQGPKNILGFFGELHPRILKQFDIKQPVVAMELNLSALPQGKQKGKEPLILSPFQAIDRDFSFVVSEEVEAGTIVTTVQKIDKILITSVDVFDVYKGVGGNAAQKAVGIRVRLTPQEKTFTDEEIQSISTRIIQAVEQTTGGTLRSEDVSR
ncbi:MAG: phenylalanine--tRNA ligase subunit beta [Alphaproteobacteria bacterium]